MPNMPPIPQAFFDEFGKSADDRVMDYGRACYEAALSARPLPSDWVAADCEKCGREAVHYLVMDNLPQPGRRMPFCEYCTQEHEQTAQEVNDHEMRHFGGSYGLVTYHYEPLAAAPSAPAEEVDALCPNCLTPWKCNGPHEPAPEPLAQGRVLCHRIVSATHEGMSTGWYNGDVPEDERKYWENGGHRIERAYASPQPASDGGLVSHVTIDFPQIGTAGPFKVIDGRMTLPDVTMNDLMHHARMGYVPKPNPPQPSASVGERARGLFDAMLSAPYGGTTMGDIVCAETTRNRLESAWLPIIESALTTAAAGGGYWKEEARRYAENADFWRNKAEGKPTQPTVSAGVPGYGGVPIDMDDPEASA